MALTNIIYISLAYHACMAISIAINTCTAKATSYSPAFSN